jgi:hypothetical protein
VRKILLLALIVTVSITLGACNSVKYNSNSNNANGQNETSKPSTEIKAISPSETVEPKIQTSTPKLGVIN